MGGCKCDCTPMEMSLNVLTVVGGWVLKYCSLDVVFCFGLNLDFLFCTVTKLNTTCFVCYHYITAHLTFLPRSSHFE